MKHVLIALVCLFGCKKAQEPTPAPGPGSAVVVVVADAAPAPDAPVADPDEIFVLAKHTPQKPTDPVKVRFSKFKVVKAHFDPEKLDGGTASIEIDLASLESGSGERDHHLQSESYLDVGKFATLTVDVDNVEKGADMTFKADATVKLHGVTKKYPIEFDVLSHNGGTYRIQGSHEFSRLDFGVGTDPKKDKEQQVDTALTIRWRLTIANT